MSNSKPEQHIEVDGNIHGDVNVAGRDISTRTTNIQSGPIVFLVIAAILAVMGVVSVVAIGAFGILSSTRSNGTASVASVSVALDDDSTVLALDDVRNIVWQRNHDSPVRKVDFIDVTGDDKPEVVVGLSIGEDKFENPGKLLVYDDAGNLLNSFSFAEASPYNAGRSSLRLTDFAVADIDNDGEIEIVVTTAGDPLFPSKLAVLTLTNNGLVQESSYWNPGFLDRIDIEDLDNDGIAEIIVQARNNNMQAIVNGLNNNARAVFMLPGDNIDGLAPPNFAGGTPGTELWYAFIVPNEIGINDIVYSDYDDDGTRDLQVQPSDACFYNVNLAGEIIGGVNGSACERENTLVFWDDLIEQVQ